MTPESLSKATKTEAERVLPVLGESWAEARIYYQTHRRQMIEAAGRAREHAVSYRLEPFKVGCAVLGINPLLEFGQYDVYQGYNFKPRPGLVRGSEKRCAERNAIDAARCHVDCVVAIVTVSTKRSTGDTGPVHDVLHPCADCRDMFRDLLQTGILRPDSVVCNVNDGPEHTPQPCIEERTLHELLKLYDHR